MTIRCDEKIMMDLEMADTFIKRFKGLMGRQHLAENAALLLKPCSSIHTCFMKFTIDVIYLDKNFYVLEKETIRPWRTGKRVRGCKMVLEMNEGQGGVLSKGDRFEIVRSQED